MQYHTLSLAQQVSHFNTSGDVCDCSWIVSLACWSMPCYSVFTAAQAGVNVCVLANQHSKPLAQITAHKAISLWDLPDT